jgi:hypothetical protein
LPELDFGAEFHPGDVRYEYVAPLNVSHVPGNRLRDALRIHSADGVEFARHWSATKVVTDPLIGGKAPARNLYEGARKVCPDLADEALVQLSRDLLGHPDSVHFIQRGYGSADVKEINSPEQLTQTLIQMAEDGDMPITAAVDTRNPPFNHLKVATPDGHGGGHVVVIHGIVQDEAGNWRVQFSNQWGDAHNFMPDNPDPNKRSYPIEDFYNSMQMYPGRKRGLDIFDKIDAVRRRAKARKDTMYRAISGRISDAKRSLSG